MAHLEDKKTIVCTAVEVSLLERPEQDCSATRISSAGSPETIHPLKLKVAIGSRKN